MMAMQIPIAHTLDSMGYFVVHWENANILSELVPTFLTLTVASQTVMGVIIHG